MSRLWSCGYELGTITPGVEFPISSPGLSVFGGAELASLAGGGITKTGAYSGRTRNPVSGTPMGFCHIFAAAPLNALVARVHSACRTRVNVKTTIMGLMASDLVVRVWLAVDNTDIFIEDEDGTILSFSQGPIATDAWQALTLIVDRIDNAGNDFVFFTSVGPHEGISPLFTAGGRSLSLPFIGLVWGLNLRNETATVGDFFWDDIAINSNVPINQNFADATVQDGNPPPGQQVAMFVNGNGDFGSAGTQGTDWDVVAPVVAIAFNSRTPGNNTLGASTTTTATSVAMTATVAASLSNSVLIATVHTDAGARSGGVAWDTGGGGVNEALTFFGEAVQGSTRCEIWYKLNPTAGAGKLLTASWSGLHHGSISCAVATGVNQSTPWNAAGPQTATGAAGSDPSLSITSAVGEWPVDAIVVDLGGASVNAPLKGASQNYIGSGVHPVNNAISAGSSDRSSAASSVTMTWDVTQAPDPNSAWAQVGGSLVPASGATIAYQQLDETTPDDDTSYVIVRTPSGSSGSANGVLDFDMIASAAAGIPSWARINCVQVGCRFRNLNGDEPVQAIVRFKSGSGGTVVESTGEQAKLFATYGTHSHDLPANYKLTVFTNPTVSGQKLTPAMLDGAQIGIRMSLPGAV